MDLIKIEKKDTFIHELQNKLDNEGEFSSFQFLSLAYQAELAQIIPSFSGLRSLDLLPQVSFLPHQVTTAKKAIEKMNGRAILADEVGLGKTIEAGLIIKEYMIRGTVKQALILVPASLVSQWVHELNTKFYIPAVAFRKGIGWDVNNVIVSSLDTAKRSPHREELLKKEYDLVLIDEAHKLKNHQTKNFEFIRKLNKKYCLLLTATPIQNDLLEIFNLISILKPGLLGDYASFKKKYGKKFNNLEDHYYLKHLIDNVMIRNTRKNTELDHFHRSVQSVWVDFDEQETEVYQSIDQLDLVKHTFTKIMLLRELCSSREACFLSLEKFKENEVNTDEIDEITNAVSQLSQHPKAVRTVELIQSIGNEKVIIFTEFRATQLYLQWYLQQNGIFSVPFRGGFKRSKKDWMIELFKEKAHVLIATEAGAEGINLQFCHHLINYDLPWNPMKLEQRIGRIHRFGQNNDVHIYNLAIRNTIEEHILTTLYEKIQLFENVIGKLDAILADLQINDFEKEIESIYASSTSADEAKIKLNNLASIIDTHVNHSEIQGDRIEHS